MCVENLRPGKSNGFRNQIGSQLPGCCSVARQNLRLGLVKGESAGMLISPRGTLALASRTLHAHLEVAAVRKTAQRFSKSSRVARPPAQLLPGCCSVERQTCIPGLYRGKEGAAISGACFSPRAQAHTAARSRSAAVECERLHNSANSKSALKP